MLMLGLEKNFLQKCHIEWVLWASPSCDFLQMVTLGIKLIMLTQARSLISSGQLSIGSLLTFFLYQKPMSVNLRVSGVFTTLSVWNKQWLIIDFCHRRLCFAMERQCPQLGSLPQCWVISTGDQSLRRKETCVQNGWRAESFSRMSPSATPLLLQTNPLWRFVRMA